MRDGNARLLVEHFCYTDDPVALVRDLSLRWTWQTARGNVVGWKRYVVLGCVL